MKRTAKFSVYAALALLALGCTKEFGVEEFSGRIVNRTFTAGFDGVSTRTELGDKGAVTWKVNDTIRYFSNNSGTVTKHVVTENSPYTTINAALQEGDKFFTAVYGASDVTVKQDGSFILSDVVLPVQDGKFPDAHVSMAYTTKLDTNRVTFKNITSLLRFEITRDDVAYVVFSSNGFDALTGGGTVKVTMSNSGEPTFTLGSIRSTSIRVNVSGAGVYYVSMLPDTYKDGMVIKSYKSDGTRAGMAVVNHPVTLAKSTISDMGKLELKLTDPTDICTLTEKYETSNCYIVPKLQEYKFPATVQGNSTAPLAGVPVSAQVLWESTNNGAACDIGDVVSGVSYEAGFVYFTVKRAGSAIVAVYDSDLEDPAKKILWSWHLWVWPGYDIEKARVIYKNNAGAMMDRNLGAVSTTPGDGGCWGLLYQWGRKDPFVGSYTTPNGVLLENVVVSSDEVGTIEYSIEHPTTFIAFANVKPGDWLNKRDDTLWLGETKSVYDPCPAGWRMPAGDFWATALGSSDNFYKAFDMEIGGMDFGGILGNDPVIWYPGSGYRIGNQQYGMWPTESGAYGMWWAAGTLDAYANDFAILKNNQVVVKNKTAVRASGYSVRCITDYIPPVHHVTSVTLDQHELELARYSSAQLNATIIPYNAENQGLTWSSSKPSVATVDQNGLVRAVSEGEAVIKVASDEYPDTVFDTCAVTVIENSETDLSAGDKTANCYVVSQPGSFRFKATVKGGSSEPVGTPSSAILLWESYGTANWYTRQAIIDYDSVKYSNGYVTFDVNAPLRNGNAVIAVKDAYGEVLWSWHIWVCGDFNPLASAQVYKNEAGIVMDRNLGATSNEPGQVQTMGLLYQWGRKDPFLGPSAIKGDVAVQAASSDPFEPAIGSNQIYGTVEYATAHPTAFITSNENYDWMWTMDNTLWASKKTMYDPCPYGWRVPDGGANGLWCTALNVDGESAYEGPVFDQTNCGTDFGGVFGEAASIWYPATAYIFGNDARIYGQGQYGPYWSVTPDAKRASILYVYMGSTQPSGSMGRSTACAVRCVKDVMAAE